MKTDALKSDAAVPLIEMFIEMMAVERGAAANTLAAYSRDLADYAGHAAKRGGSLPAATEAQVTSFLAMLSRRGVSRATAARKLSTLRQFHRFLVAEGLAVDDPTANVARPRSGRPLPKVMRE
ncbi:MAG: site-specific integrase, partial [Hyphomicrobiales bacterium]